MGLKHARVLPLLKKPTLDPDATSSYRPTSNLTYLSEVFERIILLAALTRMHPARIFCQNNNQLTVRSTNTESAVLSVYDDPVQAIDKKQVSLLVLLDLSAAFDTVDRSILLSVLSNRFSVVDTAFAQLI